MARKEDGGLRERFIEALNLVLPESWQVNFREAYGLPVDPDEQNWRPLTGDPLRDLPLVTQDRMQKISHWLWEQNPLANRIIELPVAYLLAEGVRLTVGDPENQKVLDRFWRDPINDMDIKLPKKVRELAIFGEQLYPVFTNEISGEVRLGYLDPIIIGQVVKDPDNSEQVIGVITRRNVKGQYFKFRTIINAPESVFTQRTQAIRASFTDGEAFYLRVNDLSAGSRGRSDLLHQADWLDAYDQFMYGELERYKHLRAFVWDLTLKNTTPDGVTARAKTFTVPTAGGAYVHNDSELLDPKTPDLKAQDTAEGARLFRNHMLGGASIPEHWFGGGGNVNKATASEMGDPTFKMLAMRQRTWKHALESIGRYVLFRAAQSLGQHGDIDWSDPKWTVQAVFPDLVSSDLTGNATAMTQVTMACGLALDRGLLQESTALSVIAVVAGRLGVEIDPKEELDKAKAEAAARRAEDAFNTPPLADEATSPGAASTAAAQAAGESTAALKEAADELRRFLEESNARFLELERRAAVSGDGGAALLKEAIAAQTASHARLVEALGSHTTRHELVILQGKSKTTVTTPEGRQYSVTKQDA